MTNSATNNRFGPSHVLETRLGGNIIVENIPKYRPKYESLEAASDGASGYDDEIGDGSERTSEKQDKDSTPPRLLILGLLNLGYVLAQFWGSAAFVSLTLLSDAFHNLSDVMAIGMAAYIYQLQRGGMKEDGLGRSDRLPYGFKRAEVVGGLVNSVSLIALSGYVVLNALPRLVFPTPSEASWGYALLALAGVFVNLVGVMLFFTAGNESQSCQHGGGLLHAHSHGHDHGHSSDVDVGSMPMVKLGGLKSGSAVVEDNIELQGLNRAAVLSMGTWGRGCKVGYRTLTALEGSGEALNVAEEGDMPITLSLSSSGSDGAGEDFEIDGGPRGESTLGKWVGDSAHSPVKHTIESRSNSADRSHHGEFETDTEGAEVDVDATKDGHDYVNSHEHGHSHRVAHTCGEVPAKMIRPEGGLEVGLENHNHSHEHGNHRHHCGSGNGGRIIGRSDIQGDHGHEYGGDGHGDGEGRGFKSRNMNLWAVLVHAMVDAVASGVVCVQ
ncbi:unnamed protein product, partial [Choristocarpus tenellus]